MQLDQGERGFSFMRDGPLDMRMAQDGMSAADVVNEFEERDLRHIIAVLGEEKRAYRHCPRHCCTAQGRTVLAHA
jgi:16S rRNA (cytosine1402-N4)-methyltransferase